MDCCLNDQVGCACQLLLNCAQSSLLCIARGVHAIHSVTTGTTGMCPLDSRRCAVQKALYQQQPLQVMLRGQQQVPRPMPMVRPPQRTVSGQSNVASLSIHDKRRQPVMPVKRRAGRGHTIHRRAWPPLQCTAYWMSGSTRHDLH